MRRRCWPSLFALALWSCGARVCGNLGGLELQPRKSAYSPSALFADGTIMRPRVPGTISVDAPELDRRALTGRDEKGHPLAGFPIPLTASLVARGRHAFEIYCAACHGLLGDGKSPVAEAMALRPPPSIVGKPRTPGQIFVVTTEGYGLMTSYAAQIPVRDRWGLAAYVLALQSSQRAPLEKAPTEIREQLQGQNP